MPSHTSSPLAFSELQNFLFPLQQPTGGISFCCFIFITQRLTLRNAAVYTEHFVTLQSRLLTDLCTIYIRLESHRCKQSIMTRDYQSQQVRYTLSTKIQDFHLLIHICRDFITINVIYYAHYEYFLLQSIKLRTILHCFILAVFPFENCNVYVMHSDSNIAQGFQKSPLTNARK